MVLRMYETGVARFEYPVPWRCPRSCPQPRKPMVLGTGRRPHAREVATPFRDQFHAFCSKIILFRHSPRLRCPEGDAAALVDDAGQREAFALLRTKCEPGLDEYHGDVTQHRF
ncbi:unnamed protein product [Ixodes hexagonus]